MHVFEDWGIKAKNKLIIAGPCSDESEKQVQQDEDKKVTWHKGMSSAELAYILYQVPVLVGVHAAEMLPKKK